MLEDSNRSSKASQPEMSLSKFSMRFFAKSKYRNWRSFPIDCRRTEEQVKVATAPSGCVSVPRPLANKQKEDFTGLNAKY
ncbi:hypothetical protein GOODEAATRI_032871 [Goodea atripinnis]|uniref:Uncharacterized protein n=1 Tax=Goodea atripinnis TaxID=208336 RepID=A0ABV0P000_9TELE